MNIILDLEDFKCLVRGGVLTATDGETKIILEDIGFQQMYDAIESAENGIGLYKARSQ